MAVIQYKLYADKLQTLLLERKRLVRVYETMFD